MKAYATLLFVLALNSLPACQRKDTRGSPAGTESSGKTVDVVRLAQEWFPNANYAGALMANERFGALNQLHIDILPGSDQVDAIKLLALGKSDFADVGADRVLDANARGADLVVVAVVNAISPVVFVAKDSSAIRTPQDFVGKRVGVLPGTATEMIYRLMMRRANVDRSKVREIEVPFELATFLAGQYDVRPAFAYDEPVTLKREHVKSHSILPSEVGVECLGTVYVTTRKYFETNPDRTRRFVIAVADGWLYARRHPDAAIDALKRFDPKSDVSREREALQMAEPFLKGDDGKVLFASPEHWRKMVEQLREIGAPIEAQWERSVEMKFVEAYHIRPESEHVVSPN